MTNGSQFIWWHICKTAQANTKAKFSKRATKPTHQNRHEMKTNTHDRKEERSANSGSAKVAVQCSADTFVVNQSLVLRINICAENSRLRKAANRYSQYLPNKTYNKMKRNLIK
jgi:hypothetical protein